MSQRRRPYRLLPIAAALCVLTSCSKTEPPPPSRDEIFQERLALPALYFTATTHRRVIAPASKGLFVDEQTGEACWPALACHNPDCPGRNGDEPLLFIEPDAGVYVKPDGTFGYDRALAARQRSAVAGCPECLKKRNLRKETPEQRAQYVSWVKPYVLPETAKRLKELDELLQRRIALDRRQRKAVPFSEQEPPPDGGPQPTPADPATRPRRQRRARAGDVGVDRHRPAEPTAPFRRPRKPGGRNSAFLTNVGRSIAPSWNMQAVGYR